MNKPTRRVVITGVGTVNALGHNARQSWQEALKGKSGVRPLTYDSETPCPSQVAGLVNDFNAADHLPPEVFKKLQRLGRFVHFATTSAQEALTEAKLLPTEIASERIGVVVGSGIGGSEHDVKNIANYTLKNIRAISPYHVISTIGNIASGFLSLQYQFHGPSFGVQTACASANHAILTSALMIKNGLMDVALCGGTEASITEFAVGSFCKMKALSTLYNNQPETASRPFDTGRDGFVIAEGCGLLVLEDLEHALSRGVPIIAELAGFAMNSDCYDLVAPDPEGTQVHLCMQQALKQAGLSVEDVDYINTHGTSTPIGDLAEANAIHKLLDGRNDHLHVNSIKSMIGHSLGAAAGIEAVFGTLAVRDGKVPPTINLDHFDERIKLPRQVFNTETITKPVNVMLSNSFGFGGHNSTIVLKRFEP